MIYDTLSGLTTVMTRKCVSKLVEGFVNSFFPKSIFFIKTWILRRIVGITSIYAPEQHFRNFKFSKLYYITQELFYTVASFEESILSEDIGTSLRELGSGGGSGSTFIIFLNFFNTP